MALKRAHLKINGKNIILIRVDLTIKSCHFLHSKPTKNPRTQKLLLNYACISKFVCDSWSVDGVKNVMQIPKC